jgi:hypothetical protein
VKWFLRLFEAFRALEIDLQRERDGSETALQAAEQEARLWQERCESAELRVRELTDRMLDESHKVTDAMSLRAIGRRIHSKNPEPVEMPQKQPVPLGGRMLAREQAAVNTAKFFEELSGQIHHAPVA